MTQVGDLKLELKKLDFLLLILNSKIITECEICSQFKIRCWNKTTKFGPCKAIAEIEFYHMLAKWRQK
jgi:hypothetical protein